MIRLVILDVEGVITLPGGSQEAWPLEGMLRVRRFLEASTAACALCTGRQEPYGEAVLQALNLFRPLPQEVCARMRERSGYDWLSWPSIFENGAFFYDPLAKRPVPHPSLSAERTAAIRRVRDEILPPLVERTGALLEIGKVYCLSLNPPLVAFGDAQRKSTEEFRPIVESALGPVRELVEVRHSASAIDITPSGISKASAVRLLLEWTGLRPDEVLGVGDTRADEAWLREVGHRAAPANGREALPGLDFYASSPVIDGLLEILEKYLKCR